MRHLHMLVVAVVVSAGFLASGARAALFPGRARYQLVPPPVRDERPRAQQALRAGVFQQRVDHDRPELGTFAQRFWWSDEFYAGPGAPVVLFTPGEAAADGYDGYVTNRTLPGLFAQATGAAGIVLEHRYWGASSPAARLTVESLQHLTLANAVRDLTYFARHVRLPFDAAGRSGPEAAPWVLTGGSYSGALAAWTAARAPGTFWAYHASSAVVQAVGDFWAYFAPVREGMPPNCSADVERVVAHVDGVLRHGRPRDRQALKRRFGLATVAHDDDFASALQQGPWQWQGHNFATGYSAFDEFCDYVENVWPGSNRSAPGPEGVGLQRALDGYAKWTREVMLPGTCSSYGVDEWQDELSTGCFDSHNATSPIFTDDSLDNQVNRQWQWMLCNEPFKYWQDGAPRGMPTLVSRLVDVAYWERQCGLFFPPTATHSYGIALGRSTRHVNAWTGGWARGPPASERLMYSNGQWDPWRDATVSSRLRPGGPVPSSPERPVWLIPEGLHCSDLAVKNADANGALADIVRDEVRVMRRWVDEFYDEKRRTRGEEEREG